MNGYLSGRRIGNLLFKDLVEDYRALLIAAGAVTGVLLLNYAINALSAAGSGTTAIAVGSVNSVVHLTYFTLILFLGGFIITSRAFVELHTKNKNHDWLMVPASPIEKYLSRLLLTTVGVAVGTVVYYFLFSLLGAAFTGLVFGRPAAIFNPFDGTVWYLVLHYFVLQSVFFAGAVYFKKAQFIKTVLVVTAFAFLLLLVAAGVLRLAFWRELPLLLGNHGLDNLLVSRVEPRLQAAGRTASVVSTVLYWAAFAPAFWSFAYFRLSETEVRNGV